MRIAIPLLLQYVFLAWFLVKHRDNFAFYRTYTPQVEKSPVNNFTLPRFHLATKCIVMAVLSFLL